MKIPELSQFSVYRGVSSYDDLRKVVKEFDTKRNDFRASSVVLFMSGGPSSMTRSEPWPIEVKVDKYTEQLVEISLLVRKSKTSDDYRSEHSREMSPGPAMIY